MKQAFNSLGCYMRSGARRHGERLRRAPCRITIRQPSQSIMSSGIAAWAIGSSRAGQPTPQAIETLGSSIRASCAARILWYRPTPWCYRSIVACLFLSKPTIAIDRGMHHEQRHVPTRRRHRHIGHAQGERLHDPRGICSRHRLWLAGHRHKLCRASEPPLRLHQRCPRQPACAGGLPGHLPVPRHLVRSGRHGAGRQADARRLRVARRRLRLPQTGSLPRRHGAGQGGIRHLHRAHDHRHGKPRNHPEGVVRDGEGQQAFLSAVEVVGRRLGMVVVRRRQAHRNHHQGSQRVPGLPSTGPFDRSDLRAGLSHPQVP